MYDVIAIGSSTIDAFVYTDRAESIMIKTINNEETFISYPLGSKLLINELDFFTGGGGTNASVCLARMGLNAAYIGKVGNDSNGTRILDELHEENVDFLGEISSLPMEKTGYSIILDSIEHNRTILSFRGANDTLNYSKLSKEKLKTNWFYLSTMIGKSFKTLEHITAYANENKVRIIFNPNNYLCEKGARYLEKILKNTEILILNNEEASLLTGKNDSKVNILALKELGPEIVIITDGKKPINCIDYDNNHYVVYPLDIKVVETTGAGDSFSSTFLAGFIKTRDIEFSLKLAIINSHSVLKYKGAKNKLLAYNDAVKILSDSKIRIEKNKIS
ncbi:MAG: carbohydrate kinase family protein [Candidatus Humimicrobiaceae bacterium]